MHTAVYGAAPHQYSTPGSSHLSGWYSLGLSQLRAPVIMPVADAFWVAESWTSGQDNSYSLCGSHATKNSYPPCIGMMIWTPAGMM